MIAAALGAAGLMSNMITNQTNQQNFERQMGLTRYMYDDTKYWNSAPNQVRLLRAAGLNPALVYGQGAGGTASAVSQPSSPVQNPLDLNGLSSIASGVALNHLHADNIEADTEKKMQEAAGLAKDNLFKAENWKSVIYNRDMQSWLNEQLSDAAKLDVEFSKESFKDRLRDLRYNVELKDAQIVAQDLINQYLPSKLPEEVNEIVSRCFANYATGRSSLKTAHAAMMNALSQRGAFDAQYGATPDDRRKFFKATLDYMLQHRDESISNEYKNYLTPMGSIGLTNISLPGPAGVKSIARKQKHRP